MTTQKQKKIFLSALSFTLKVALGLLFISPLIICVLFSFQPEELIGRTPPTFFTNRPTLDHYRWVFQNISVLSYMKNSLVVCFITITCQVFFASLAAYAFTFFEFPGKSLLFTLILASMMIPGDIVIITNYAQIQKWGMTDKYIGLVLPHLISGTAIFLMRQCYMTLPKDIKSAATIDGCGDMGFLFRIAMPLSIPSVASLSIYLFILIYNQYFWPLLVTNKDTMRTIQIGMAMLVSSERLQYGPLLAGAATCILPVVVIFIFGQDYIVKGMTAGSVKG